MQPQDLPPLSLSSAQAYLISVYHLRRLVGVPNGVAIAVVAAPRGQQHRLAICHSGIEDAGTEIGG